MPNIFFMGVYIYPLGSRDYSQADYGCVIDEINYWIQKGCQPYIGGDFNSRLGDINEISTKSLKWRYSKNLDDNINSHRNHFKNMCDLLNILPLNHCVYITMNTLMEIAHITKE